MENKQVTYNKLVEIIATDFNLDCKKDYTLRFPANKPTIKKFVRGAAIQVRIFDGVNEHPYILISGRRNEEALSNCVELRLHGGKSLLLIEKETGAKIISENCRVDEGGGCYSNGTRYSYKEFYCEV